MHSFSLKTYFSAALDELINGASKDGKPPSWKNLYNRIFDDDTFITDRENFYKYALFKGLGDIGQEMSVLMKHGGIQDTIHTTSVFNVSGDSDRIFFANDRPSANRVIINCILKPTGINTGAIGCFFNNSKDITPNTYYCDVDNSPGTVEVETKEGIVLDDTTTTPKSESGEAIVVGDTTTTSPKSESEGDMAVDSTPGKSPEGGSKTRRRFNTRKYKQKNKKKKRNTKKNTKKNKTRRRRR